MTTIQLFDMSAIDACDIDLETDRVFRVEAYSGYRDVWFTLNAQWAEDEDNLDEAEDYARIAFHRIHGRKAHCSGIIEETEYVRTLQSAEED